MLTTAAALAAAHYVAADGAQCCHSTAVLAHTLPNQHGTTAGAAVQSAAVQPLLLLLTTALMVPRFPSPAEVLQLLLLLLLPLLHDRTVPVQAAILRYYMVRVG